MTKQQLKEVGLKTTVARLRILQILKSEQTQHLTAEAIHKIANEHGSPISLATVYRVLNQLSEVGLVAKQLFEGTNAVFELHKGEDHGHLVCTKCTAVIEFFDTRIRKRQIDIAKEHGFVISNYQLSAFGVCAKCAIAS